jgi:hypothetical protein
VDYEGNVWSCKRRGGRGFAKEWRKLKPIVVQGHLAVQLSKPAQKVLIAELVLVHFGSPRPSDEAVIRFREGPLNCAFDALSWDQPTDDEAHLQIKLRLRQNINNYIKQHAPNAQREWHQRANKHAGIRSQTADDVTEVQLLLKFAYLCDRLGQGKDL